MTSNKQNLLLSLFSTILLIIGGLFLIQYLIIGIILVFIGLFLQIVNFINTSRKIDRKIDGEGVHRIITSDKEAGDPKNYKEGDLYIRYKNSPDREAL